jgi:hypothetical protein
MSQDPTKLRVHAKTLITQLLTAIGRDLDCEAGLPCLSLLQEALSLYHK